MSTKNKNVKTSHLSDDELLSHTLMYQVVFLLRTIAAQCHMLVPERLNAIIKRWVGHGLCEVTALPSKLSCPVTGKTFFNKEVYKDYYQKNKKKINKIKKKNKGETPSHPTDRPKFPDVDWAAFLKADNHHKNVIDEVRKSRVGPHIKSSTIWNFSTGPLKAIDYDVRPGHCGNNAVRANISPLEAGGRNVREVICHGTNYDQLMALIAWYAIGETSDHNGWCTGIQQKPEVRQVRACSIGDTVYENIVQTKAWIYAGDEVNMRRQLGQCHINALRILLSEGKGSLCVGYHAVAIPCLSFYTIVLEAHVVYFDGKTYWDSTYEGKEMMSDTGLFVPLMMIDIEGKRTTDDVNRYRAKHSYVKCQIMKSYNEQIPMATSIAEIRKLKRETEFFYKAMLQFDDVAEIRCMCRDMCNEAPWLNNPKLASVDVRPSPVHGKGLFSVNGCEKGEVIFQEHSDGGMLISAPAHVILKDDAHGLDGVQNNCSYVWGLIMGGDTMKGWIANLCLNPRILDHMTEKDHELVEYLVTQQAEGRSPEHIEMFRATLVDTFNRLECNQFTVDVPGAMAPLNVMSYVGDKCSKLNHSDEPNCRMQSEFRGTELMFVQAIALRSIVAGEELFIDYGDEYKQMMFTNRDSIIKKVLEKHKKEAKPEPLNKQGIELARRVARLAGLTPGVDGFEKVHQYCTELADDTEFMERAFIQIQSKEDLERLMAAELRKRFREVEGGINHVSNGRSGDDHKRQELEETSEATGNNQIEFKDIVSNVLDSYDSPDERYGPLSEIVNFVIVQVKRELTGPEVTLVNEMLMMRKRYKVYKEKALVNKLYGDQVQLAEKALGNKKRKSTTSPRGQVKAARKSGPAKVKLLTARKSGPAKVKVKAARKSGPAKVKVKAARKSGPAKAARGQLWRQKHGSRWTYGVVAEVGDRKLKLWDRFGLSNLQSLGFLTYSEYVRDFDGSRWTYDGETVSVRLNDPPEGPSPQTIMVMGADAGPTVVGIQLFLERATFLSSFYDAHNAGRLCPYPLIHVRDPILDEDHAVELSGLLLIWARVVGLPDQTLNHAMLMKIRDMEMVMGFSQTHRDRAVAFADEAFSNTSDGVEMIEYVEGEEIFLRVETYYRTFLRIPQNVIENFVDDYYDNWQRCRKYEVMINVARQEITKNFSSEHEKEDFEDHVKSLDETDSEWRENVNGDWRIKDARGETGGPQ